MKEGIFYGICLLFYCIGGLSLLLGRPAEPSDRPTLAGRLRAVFRRIREQILRQEAGERLEKKYRELAGRQMEREIYDGSLLLKNLALAEKEQAFSADYLYEKLMENAERMRPVYAEMLSLYRSGRDLDAFRLVSEHCPTRAGRNFSMVLEKLGKIRPDELVEQMEVFQEQMRQQKMTEDIRQVQRNSLITTVMATAVVFLMVIDFAVVIVFMHTMTILETVF